MNISEGNGQRQMKSFENGEYILLLLCGVTTCFSLSYVSRKEEGENKQGTN